MSEDYASDWMKQHGDVLVKKVKAACIRVAQSTNDEGMKEANRIANELGLRSGDDKMMIFLAISHKTLPLLGLSVMMGRAMSMGDDERSYHTKDSFIEHTKEQLIQEITSECEGKVIGETIEICLITGEKKRMEALRKLRESR